MKLQLRQPSPGKPDPKGIAPKKIVSSSGLLIQIFERKPIRSPTQKQEKVFRSIENNQEKSKEPGTAHTVQKKEPCSVTNRRNQKKKTWYQDPPASYTTPKERRKRQEDGTRQE